MSQRIARGARSPIAAFAIVIAAACSRAASAHAWMPTAYDIDAEVDAEEGVVTGTMSVQLQRDSDAQEVRLWLLADRLSVVPSAVDDLSYAWIFSGEPAVGGAAVSDVHVDGAPASALVAATTLTEREARGTDLVVQLPTSSATDTHTLTLRFRIDVPERFGRLGRRGDVISLAAPWYPLVLGDDDAFRRQVLHRVHLRTPPGFHTRVGAEVCESRCTTETRGAYVPVLVAPELERRVTRCTSTSVSLTSFERTYRAPDPRTVGVEGVTDLVRIDPLVALQTAACDVVATLSRVAPTLVPTSLDIVTVPSRVELAANAPGWVTISDRFYEVFPAAVLREFQLAAVRRAIFRTALVRRVDALEPLGDRAFATDVRAAVLTDIDAARRHGHAQRPEELLSFAAFHPTVDQLLYAPQIPFAGVYFGAVDDVDRFHDDPERARRATAGGRRVLESARDALVEDAMHRFVDGLVRLEQPLRAVLRGADSDVAERLDAWLDAPNRLVNYRIEDARSNREGDAWVHRVVVVRDGAERIEPVDVEVTDEDGMVTRGRWDGRGRRDEVTLRSRAALDVARIDPRGRLVESAEVADGHPRADDATSQPFRPPILQAFALDIAVAEGRVDGLLDFALRRRFDLERTVAARIESAAAGQELGLRYVLGVGPKRDTNARVAFLSFGGALQRLAPGFGGDARGAYGAVLTVSGGYDSRWYRIDPVHGSSIIAAVQGGGVRRSDGEVTATLSAGVRGAWMLPWSYLQKTLVVAGAGYTLGPALAAQQQGIAGRFLLRGFEAGELLGRGRLYGVVEHRMNLVTDLDWNALHIAWIRQLELATFLGGGVVFDERRTGRTRWAAEVGVGLRLLFDWAGVQPGALSVDVAVPLTRESRNVVVDGELVRRRAPYGLYVSFDQFF